MSIANFVPEFWSTRLLRHLDSKLVYAGPQISNRLYEGEIQGVGDTVHIQKVGDPTVKERTKYQDIEAPEQPSGDTRALTIDEDWYFNVSIDDVDAWQANVRLLDQFAERAARGMREKVDSTTATKLAAGAGVEVDASVTVTVGNTDSDDYSFFTLLVEARRLLDNNDAPEDNRWVVIPPDLEAIAIADERFVPAAALGDTVTRTGMIGQIAGFTVVKTTAVPSAGGAWDVLFGAGNYANTFAQELTKLEAYRPEKRFEDALKGLNVWGSKVIEPETLGIAKVDDGTGSGS